MPFVDSAFFPGRDPPGRPAGLDQEAHPEDPQRGQARSTKEGGFCRCHESPENSEGGLRPPAQRGGPPLFVNTVLWEPLRWQMEPSSVNMPALTGDPLGVPPGQGQQVCWGDDGPGRRVEISR